MLLADADKSKEIDPNASKDDPESTINIHHDVDGGGTCPVYDNGGICREPTHWKWSISGRSYTKDTIKEKLKELAELSPEAKPDPDAKRLLSKRRIMVRADRAAPYGDVQKVIEYCGQATLYKVAVVGALPQKE